MIINNKEREYLGLTLIEPSWEEVIIDDDSTKQVNRLFFAGDVLKKIILESTDSYKEFQYEIKTKDRTSILPKTKRGKEQKLTLSNLKKRKPIGLSFIWVNSNIAILNQYNGRYFYSTHFEGIKVKDTQAFNNWLAKFIDDSDDIHFRELVEFKNVQRKTIQYKKGDIFSFKIQRKKYAFGKILLDIEELRQKRQIPSEHVFNSLLGIPLLIKVYLFVSDCNLIDLQNLDRSESLPTFYMLDNPICNGEYKIIGNTPIQESEIDFPVSFGKSVLQHNENYILQWGLINIAVSPEHLYKNLHLPSSIQYESLDHDYRYNMVSAGINYTTKDILFSVEKGFSYNQLNNYKTKYDLRNPMNHKLKEKLFTLFGLDHFKTYSENCLQNKVDTIEEMLHKL